MIDANSTSNGGCGNRQGIASLAKAKPKSVAIVGAGASGLVCAKECVREGHTVRVFERSKVSGGTWVVEPIPPELHNLNVLSKDFEKHAARICSSMYEDLRTNLPREIMGFLCFPFDDKFGNAEDRRRHCCHQEVRRYLEAFKTQFQLERLIEYESCVVRVEHYDRDVAPWDVDVQSKGKLETFQFDAVIIASGHLTVPDIPSIKGIDLFKRQFIHSHLYRNPSPYKDLTVVLLGNSYSGRDLVEQISSVAKTVYFCGRAWPPDFDLTTPVGPRKNIHRCWTIEECVGYGQLRLKVIPLQGIRGAVSPKGGRILCDIDVMIFCTGYLHDYPFLKGSCSVSTENRIVYPLYKHVFHGHLPTLAFPLMPTKVIPFPLAEYQAMFIARVFSERVQLPDRQSRMEVIDSKLAELKMQNIPLEFVLTLLLFSDVLIRKSILNGRQQCDYMNELASLCSDVDRVPEWWETLRDLTRETRVKNPYTYRDIDYDDPCFEEARVYYASLRQNGDDYSMESA